jgi:hypothetical protein
MNWKIWNKLYIKLKALKWGYAIDEIINPITNRCIKFNGSIFLKLDLTKLSINDQEKINHLIIRKANEQIIKKKIIKKKS